MTRAEAGVPDNRRFRVLVLDDHEIVNWGFRLLLTRESWVERCLTAINGSQSLALARRFQPHVALVDLFLGAASGVDVARELVLVSPRTRILLLADNGKVSPKTVRAAGAAGYVSKGWRPDDLARAVRMVGLGLALTPFAEDTESSVQLSRREREVLALISRGYTNDAIANELALSLHTVKQHASVIYRKLDVRNRAEAVQRGERLGYIY
jgi:DNA-binding NarL/FixJ family response regulator